MRVLGMISGTSHDGVDCAVVDLDPDDGTGDLVMTVRHRDSIPYDDGLRRRIRDALPPAPTSFHEVCALDTLIGRAFAEAAAACTAAVPGIELAVSHGQTMYHLVDGGTALGTLQLGQPAWIAERTGLPVVSDLRARDIAAGGQGAPLASTLDRMLLRGRDGVPAALNLGGISNVTVVDADGARAWDIGPANALLDAVVVDRDAHPAGYDAGGAIAATGSVDARLLETLLAEPYYRLAPPKSTGKELFHLDHVRRALAAVGRTGIGTADLLATLVALTVRTVADALEPERATEVFVSGGGARNTLMMSALADALPGARVTTTDELGVAADDKEAVLMALIGWSTVHGLPANTPSATGAVGARMLGSITPGGEPLRLSALTRAPVAIRIRA